MLLVLQEQELILQEQEGIIQTRVSQKAQSHRQSLPTMQLIKPMIWMLMTNDCDDITTAKVALMDNLSRYGLDVLSVVPHFDNTNNDMLNQTVQDINSSAQQDVMILNVFEQLSQQVTNCNKVNKDNLISNESLCGELERYKDRVKLIEERSNVDLGTREKLIIDDIIRHKDAQFADFEKEINSLKQTLFEQLKENESLTKTFNVFKNESKEKEAKNIDNKIALEKKVKELDNIVYKMDFSKHFVPQQELSTEQTFWFQMSNTFMTSSDASPVKVDVPSELPKVSLVNASLKKLKFHLAQFDSMVKNQVTPNALTEGE
nr:hypothetical protein [Tanacetum cinerariifolium]